MVYENKDWNITPITISSIVIFHVAKVVYENKDWNIIIALILFLDITAAKVVYENKDWNNERVVPFFCSAIVAKVVYENKDWNIPITAPAPSIVSGCKSGLRKQGLKQILRLVFLHILPFCTKV